MPSWITGWLYLQYHLLVKSVLFVVLFFPHGLRLRRRRFQNFPPARPGWRTGNVRPSRKKKRDSELPPPAAPPPGPDPRAQVRDWAQWHRE